MNIDTYSGCKHSFVVMHISLRATALAILSEKNGLEALKTSPTPQNPLSEPTPLQLLIKEMPGEKLQSFPDQYFTQISSLWYT